MKLINIAGGELNSTILTLSDALGDKGAEVARDIRTDPAFVERVAKHMLAGAPEQLVRTEGLITAPIAKAIMGNDRVFGPAEVARFTGTTLDPRNLVNANIVPYKLQTLVDAKPNNLLVYGVPTTILQICTAGSRLNFRWPKPKEDTTSFTDDTLVQGWYLICREPVSGTPTEGVVRWATLVEIYLALSLHKEVSPRHNFFLAKPAWCQQTKEGGEVLFGFGQAITGKRYGEGSHDYWAVKGPPATTLAKGRTDYVRVILPDDPTKE